MLKRSIISTALSLTNTLAANNRFVQAVSGSWVSECNTGLRNVELMLHDVAPISLDESGSVGKWCIYDYENAIEKAAITPDLAGIRTHDIVMESRVLKTSEHACSMLSHARNVVNPIIEDVESRVQVLIAESHVSALSPLSVVSETRHTFWYSPIFSMLTEDYAEREVRSFDVKKVLGAVTITSDDEAMVVLNTGSETVDGSIRELVHDCGFAVVSSVYDKLLNADANDWFSDSDLSIHSGNPVNILIAFLILNHFAGKKDLPPVDNFNDDELSSYFSVGKAELGRRLAAYVNIRDSYTSEGKLVIRYPNVSVSDMLAGNSDTIILVNPDLYDSFLEQGGTPEAIFGAFLSGKDVLASEILANAEGFVGVWNNVAIVLMESAKAKYENVVHKGVELVMARVISELKEDESTIPKATLHNKLDEVMSEAAKSNYTGTVDLYRLCRRVVCRVLFAHLDAEEVLIELDNASEANPGIEPREAAFLAFIELLSSWIADQLDVTIV